MLCSKTISTTYSSKEKDNTLETLSCLSNIKNYTIHSKAPKQK